MCFLGFIVIFVFENRKLFLKTLNQKYSKMVFFVFLKPKIVFKNMNQTKTNILYVLF